MRGALAPIIGAISMDYTTLDVGNIPGVSVGDTVTLIGEDGGKRITIPELAGLVGTIPYEIACSLGKHLVGPDAGIEYTVWTEEFRAKANGMWR